MARVESELPARRRILIVDDVKLIREHAQATLWSAGYEVDVAETGMDGLARALQDLPDLALVDHYMPGMSGVELVRILRAHSSWKHRPILGYTAAADAFEMIEAGCCEVVSKPSRRGVMLEVVEFALARCGTERGCVVCRKQG